MLAWAHTLTVTVSLACTYRNGDFYQRHLQKLYKMQQQIWRCGFGVAFSFPEGSGKCVFVRSLCWPGLETWQSLCSLTEDAGRWAGHIRSRPGKAMAMGIVPCTKAEPSSSTWSHTALGENVLLFVLFSVHPCSSTSKVPCDAHGD